MVTYVSSSRNQFRSPSGAPNEAPDGPGAFQTLSQDIDDRLGIGGAEYAASVAALQAIPSGRLFAGKLGYVAANGITYRYTGAGQTALLANAPTSAWTGWHKAPTSFSPTFTTGLNGTVISSVAALWGISAGLLWISAFVQYSSAQTLAATAEAFLTMPSTGIGSFGDGQGIYAKGGTTATNAQIDLACYCAGTAGQASTTLRIRQRFVDVAAAPVKINSGLGVAGAASDWMLVNFRGPSGAVA